MALFFLAAPDTVNHTGSARIPDIVFELGVPILGICYGMQIMAVQLGGDANSAEKSEFGFAQVRARNHSELLRDISDEINVDGHGLLDVWMSHGIEVSSLPKDFKLIASTDNCPIAGFANEGKTLLWTSISSRSNTYKTREKLSLSVFVTSICKCKKNWTTENIIDSLLKKIKDQVGDNKVLLGLSGGVDSSVLAALLHQAIDDQLTCVFVDIGLLRLNEGDEVMENLY